MEMVDGIILYTIESGGCLNGVFTNKKLDGEIYNEIARKHTETGDNDLSGEYNCFYFDTGEEQNLRCNAELSIGIKNGTKGTYSLLWEIDGKPVFEGLGYHMNEKQLVVHYWDKE